MGGRGMTIETKYNKGDIVYVLNNGQIIEVIVQEINAVIPKDSDKAIINYILCGDYKGIVHRGHYRENRIFDTKVEAAMDWLKAQGLDIGIKENR
jgi:hypothetical protein